MLRHTVLPMAVAMAFLPSIAHADGANAREEAEKRLRGCIAAGASSAPRTSLAVALRSVRAFCGPQIGSLADLRVRDATAGLTGARAEEAKRRALTVLNDEIAYAVANFTGLAN